VSDPRYRYAHQQKRKQWEPAVQAGDVNCHAIVCLMPSRWINPADEWDLGHTPDGTTWTGPEHPTCNRSEGARRGNGTTTTPHSRDW
jgi:hypothetical protein